MALTEERIAGALIPMEKPYKISDSGGLFLLVMPTGSKYWRMKYRFDGKEKLLAFGVYPNVSLELARQRCHSARELLAEGVDPGAVKKAEQSKETEDSAQRVTIESDGTVFGTKVRIGDHYISGVSRIKIHPISENDEKVRATITFDEVVLKMKINDPVLRFSSGDLIEG